MREDDKDGLLKLEAELDYRTTKLVEKLDELNEQVSNLEFYLLSLMKILGQNGIVLPKGMPTLPQVSGEQVVSSENSESSE
jgi:hypothetical protein